MARPQNKHTTYVRQAVTNWLTRCAVLSFTAKTLYSELSHVLDSYAITDPVKSLGNELLRREKAGMLISEQGEPDGVGRPCRIYRQRWK